MKYVPLALAFLLLPLAPATAWEYAFGPDTTADQGLRRVLPYRGCIGGWPAGYVTVGTTDQFGAADVYVVYTDLNGWPVWEMTYDVLNHGFEDEGVAILEIPNRGFVFLSNVFKAGVQWLPALTFIRCDGSFVRSVIYPDAASGFHLFGRDLIRTRTGDQSRGTAPGDFAIAGSWWNGSTEDAFLMRTNAGGMLLWNLAYDVGGQEAFGGLTEATPQPGQTTGDLVAVGRYDSGSSLDGLVARVDGDDGGIAPLTTLQCLASHGGADQDEYRSVVELSTPPYAGEFAMAGKTQALGWPADIAVTRGDPCALLGQGRIGDAGTFVRDEEAFDLVEALDPVSGATVGSLALAGFESAPGGQPDAALLHVDQATLLPMYGSTFGGPQAEVFYSLAENPVGGAQPPGFILAGKTETDWAAVGDPRDLYLVFEHTDLATCRTSWTPGGGFLGWAAATLTHAKKDPAIHLDEKAGEAGVFTPVPICP